MQHGPFARRHFALALLLALVAGVRTGAAETLSIEWDPNPEPEVVGYRVFVGTQPGIHDSQVDVGNSTSYTLSAAQPGQRYCFAVAAYFAGPTLGNKSADVCTDTNKPPVLQSPGNQSSAIGAAVTLTLVGSDPDGLPVTYSATGLPAGLTLNRNTGFISGAPTTATTSNVTVTVSDGVLSVSQAFTWSVSASIPGVATPLRPSGTLTSATPTFEWESVPTTTSYRLWVDDSSNTDPRIQLDVTPAQAGCTSAGAVCRLSPGVALQPGRGSWSVRPTNSSGPGPWSGAMDFTVPDASAPTVTIAAPTAAASFTTAATTIALGGTAADDAGISSVTWTNNLGGSGTATGTSNWSVASVPVKVGTNVITVTARDNGGNIATDVLTVTKNDGQPPTLTIASPAAVSSSNSATVGINGTATDDGGVTQVTWVNDRGGSGTANGTSVWGIAAVALKPGPNVITVTAHDGAGNKTPKSVTISLADGEAPTVVIAAPVAASTLTTSNATIALGGTAADNIGITQVTWSNDMGGNGVAAGTTAWTVAGVTLKPGANVITVTAKDAAGNAATDVLTVTLNDGAGPDVSITTPTSDGTHTTAATRVTLGGTASDAFGVKEVRWTNDRGGAGLASGTTSWTAADVALASGVNVITVTAYDRAGNISRDRMAITASRDSQAPAVSILAPTNAGTFMTSKAALALSGKATDNVATTLVTWQNSRGGSGTAAGTGDWSVPGVALVAGANVITITARDAAGNVGTDTLTVTLDARGPAIAFTTPTSASGYATNEASIGIAGLAKDDTQVTEVTWSSSQGERGVAAGTTSWSVGRIALKPGLNTLTVTARDSGGNTASETLAVRVTDVKAPGVRIMTPSTDPSFSSAVGVINLEGLAQDDFAVARITWANDRGGSGVATGDARWAVGGLTLQPGVNVITVTAFDASGNTSTDAARINFERGLPSISLTSPTTASSYTTSSSNVALTGVASDSDGITRVKWVTDKGQAGDAVGTTSWSIPALTVALGTTRVTVSAYDNSGNSSSVALSIVHADTIKPTLKIYVPTTASSITTSAANLTIAGTATDNVGVTEVTWTTDGGAKGRAFGSPGAAASWTTASLPVPSGTTVVTFTARDAAGNTATAVLTVTKSTSSSSPSASYASPAGF